MTEPNGVKKKMLSKCHIRIADRIDNFFEEIRIKREICVDDLAIFKMKHLLDPIWGVISYFEVRHKLKHKMGRKIDR